VNTDETSNLVKTLTKFSHNGYVLFHRSQRKKKRVFRVSFRDRIQNYTVESPVSEIDALRRAVKKLHEVRGGGGDELQSESHRA